MLRLTNARLVHIRADLERTAATHGGRIPLTVKELGGLLARLDAAEGVCRTLTAEEDEESDLWIVGNRTLAALQAWAAVSGELTFEDEKEVTP